MAVELTRGTNRRTTNFFLAKGQDRWYVRTANMDPLQDFCTQRR